MFFIRRILIIMTNTEDSAIRGESTSNLDNNIMVV